MPKVNIKFLLPAPAHPCKHSSNSLDSYTVSITSVVVDDDYELDENDLAAASEVHIYRNRKILVN